MSRFIQPNILLYFFLLLLGASGFFFALVWPYTLGFYIFIIFAALGGFGVALYIYYTKKFNAQLVCPTGSNCNAVVTSRYSKFLGVSLERWGMAYYAIIITSYIGLIVAPHLFSQPVLALLMMLTTGAFFFSLYLLFVQAVLLRQWCIWCLLSASLSIGIFIFSLAKVDFAIAVLKQAQGVIGTMQALGFSLGLGGTTAAIFLFYRFLRDLDIDENEYQTLKAFSELIWVGLALVLMGQFVTFVSGTQNLAQSAHFFVQTSALLVTALSGAVLMIILTPFLDMIPFTGSVQGSPLVALRRPMFVTGAIAFSSWYFAYVSGYLPDFNLTSLFLIYGAIVAAGVIISLIWERNLSNAGKNIQIK